MSSSILTNTSLHINKSANALGTVFIQESTGTVVDASNGTIILHHNNPGGQSNIVFKSSTNSDEYGYIQYLDDINLSTTNEKSRFIFGTLDTNNNGCVVLQKNGGSVYVGSGNSGSDALVIKNGAGSISSIGYMTREGIDGGFQGHQFNFYWLNGSILTVYVDNLIQNRSPNTPSDYRLKENIKTQTKPALERIMKIRPVTYEPATFGSLYKESDAVIEGFIAHELAEVIPSAVTGEKDDPTQIQGLALDSLCSVIVKAIQERQIQIQNLQSTLDSIMERISKIPSNIQSTK